MQAGRVISVCPEVAGGLPTPRPPAEIIPDATAQSVLQGKGYVKNIHGDDVTAQFIPGAKKALRLAQQHQIKVAILKAHSPSCGSRHIYNGTFFDEIIAGMGVTAALLTQHGIQVFNERQIDAALDAAVSRS